MMRGKEARVVVASLIAMAVAIVAASCGYDDPVAPNARLKPALSIMDPGGTATVDMPVADPTVTVLNVPLPAYAERRVVEIRMHAALQKAYTGYPPLNFGTNGYSSPNAGGCGYAVTYVEYTEGHLWANCTNGAVFDQVDTTVIRGSGAAKRTAAEPPCDRSNPSYCPRTYAGGGSATVTTLDVPIQLYTFRAPSDHRIYDVRPAGVQQVYFEYTFPADKRNLAPYTTVSWTYRNDDGSAATAVQCLTGTEKGCWYQTAKSGTMVVTATINGVTKMSESHVQLGSVGIALTTDKWGVGRDSTVRFTAHPKAATANGAPAVLTVDAWQWVADTMPGATAACSASNTQADTLCVATMKESGTMWVYGSVAGIRDSASRHVDVVDCPTGDGWLDSRTVREAMASAWRGSSPYAPPEQRVERGVTFYDSSGTLIYRDHVAISPPDTPCSNVPRGPYLPYATEVANGHTHPFELNDVVPASCHPATQQPMKYTDQKFGGPSEADWVQAGTGRPQIVVDSTRLFVAQPLPANAYYWKGDTAHVNINPLPYLVTRNRRDGACVYVRY